MHIVSISIPVINCTNSEKLSVYTRSICFSEHSVEWQIGQFRQHRRFMWLTDGCYYGEIRLVGGESEREGRLEVCNNGRWGSVCGTQWRDRHTAVVCRYLGFSDLPTGELVPYSEWEMNLVVTR